MADESYEVRIGRGLQPRLTVALRKRPLGQRYVIITDAHLHRQGESLLGAFRRRGLSADLISFPAGEGSKSRRVRDEIEDGIIRLGAGRDTALVALGGGVVGDLAGFVAATFKRGIPCVQIPTTLVGMVDSAIGGKTGINHPAGKNLIGAFHQPSAVLADTDTLQTLPPRELRAGLAEVIKYGLICDDLLFAWLEQNMEKLLAHDAKALTYVIRKSCEIKASIVGRDEREQGDRALLNLGHTFGHALESATGYTKWLHGEAVGAGLLMAATMSCESGLISAAAVERLRKLLVRTGLPTEERDVRVGTALEHMRIDKKVKSGRIRLVLLRSIGASFVTADYADAALQRTLEAHLG